jgi:hypothetical protein
MGRLQKVEKFLGRVPPREAFEILAGAVRQRAEAVPIGVREFEVGDRLVEIGLIPDGDDLSALLKVDGLAVPQGKGVLGRENIAVAR